MTFNSVVVTGGAGVIGIQVCNQLSARGLQVTLFDLPEQIVRVRPAIDPRVRFFYGSVLDSSALRDALRDKDAVIHLAARLGVKRTEANKLACLEINVDGTKKVLESMVSERVEKIIFASSSEVYGEPEQNPVTEETPAAGTTVYAVSKHVGEHLCRAYSERYPWLKSTILRFFNTYGPYQTAQFVVPRFVANVQQDRPPIINGDGRQRRSYCHAADIAGGVIEALIRDEATGEVFNLGNGEEPISLSDLADLVISLAGKDGKISPLYQADFRFTDREEDREIRERFCDTTKARRVLDFKPSVSLKEGIQELVVGGTLFERWGAEELLAEATEH